MGDDVKIERIDTRSEAISRFVLPDMPDDLTLASAQAIHKVEILKMDGEQTGAYLKACSRFSRFVSQDAAQHFIDLVRAAKKAHKPFYGYKEYNLAAYEMTGYTGNRLRQIARGDVPTKLPVHRTQEEIDRRADKKTMAARVEKEIRAKDAAAAAGRRDEAERKKEGENTDNPSRQSVSSKNRVVTEDAKGLGEAIAILQSIVFSVKESKELKSSITMATAFLKAHDASTEPIPSAKRQKTTAERKAEAEAALKNEAPHAPTQQEMRDFNDGMFSQEQEEEAEVI